MTALNVLTKTEVQEYVSFFREYYPINDLQLCVIRTNERTWRILYTWMHEAGRIIQQALAQMSEQERKNCTKIVPESESHGSDVTTWEDSLGYFVPTVNLLNYIEVSEKNKFTENLKEISKGTEFFIMLRNEKIKDRFQFLACLFHEIMHTIEIKTEKPIFRGSTIQQETQDQEEIIFPYVRQFLKEQKI
jgi:hypothetical protein